MHRLNKAAATLPIILVCGCGGGGGTGTQSSPDPPVNTTPVAEAGTSSAFDAGDLVTLDCSGSSDPQGDQLSFRWRQLDGPLVQLSDEKACNPGFTAPDATTPVTFELTVSDSLFDSSDRVTHQIRAPLPIPAIRFAEFGTDAGIAPYSMAIGPHAGVAAEDFDGDGFVDLFVPNGLGVPDQLYKNNGDGTFVDVAAVVGLDLVQNHRSALWIDYDGDHDLDLIIGGDCRAD
ncbi:MAG: FG-GAP-like repeat-containing protein, partial [Woeseiaceae bacterium]